MIATPVAASAVPGFAVIEKGPRGGRLLRGIFPDAAAPRPLREGLLYLPPAFSRTRRYPVLYLLHGMPGDPSEYADSLRLAATADGLIARGYVRPFIAVAPAAGSNAHYNGEWAGPWERYVVAGVVPWVDRHLPTRADAEGRTLAGLSAGGFGAVDIGLRSPRLFGRLESWSGYFSPLRDGPFRHAGDATLQSNDPVRLVAREATLLRRLGMRFFLGSGPSHSHWFKEQATVDFAARLRTVRLPVTLRLFASRKGEWREQLEAGVRWAFGRP